MNVICIPYTPEAAVDAAEAEAVRRHAGQRELAGELAEAAARAEETWRLETALRTQPRKTEVRAV